MNDAEGQLDAQLLQIRLLANGSIDARVEVSAALSLIINRGLPRPGGDPSVADTVRLIIKSRRLRVAILGNDLFADPAWDMLLELYLAFDEKRSMSITSLCQASQVPTTTALRHIQHLERRTLIVRRGDHRDSRRVLVDATPAALTAVEAVACNFAPNVADAICMPDIRAA